MQFICRAVFSVFAFLVFSLAASLPAFAVTVTSSTHPTFLTHDFSRENPFATYQREGGVASGARFKLENGILKIENEHAGSFGVDTKTPVFDAEKFGHVFFDYLLPAARRRDETTRVNVFARVKEIYHGARFTGPEGVRPGGVFLGTIEGVQADGRWHRAYLPLRDWLRKLYPADAQLQVQEIIIGNWDPTNYLMAGIGGNSAGANWQMDNFVVTGAGPGAAKFSVKDDNGAPLTRPSDYFWSLDGGAPKALQTAEIALSASDGFHVLQILDTAKQPVASYGFFVAAGAPRVGQPQLADNSLQIPIAARGGLNLKSLRLTVSDHATISDHATVSDRSFQTNSPFLSWDGARGVLALDAAAAGFAWKDREAIAIALDGVRDVLGRESPAFKSTLEMNYAAHKAVPPAPQVVEFKRAGVGTFEDSLEEWSPRTVGEGPAIVERDDTTKASGQYSLRLTSTTNSSTFGAWARRTAFDATKFPVLEFDYRVPRDVRVDLLLQVGGQIFSVGFTDNTPQYSRLGQIPKVQADDQWHHARVDLLNWLRKARPAASAYNVEWLALSDSGYLGNARGLQYWIDNFQLMPVLKGAPFRSRVELADVTGIKALSWVLDDATNTVPAAAPTASGDTLEVNAAGQRWLHVRAQNGAGQWSETAHYPLLLDAAPPSVGDVTPARDAKSGATRFSVAIADDAGIDPSSIALTLQGNNYSLRDEAMSYSPANKSLTLDLQELARNDRLLPLADGTRVSWKLAPVRDAAGQTAPETSGEWVYDFSADKIPPSVEITSPSHGALFWRSFENEAGNVSRRAAGRFPDAGNQLAIVSAQSEPVVRDELAGGAPNRAMRFRRPNATQPLALRLTTRPTDINRYNLIGFHYKIGTNVKLALRLSFGNQQFHISLSGDAPNSVGAFSGIVADDQWHWAQFDLRTIAGRLPSSLVPIIDLVEPEGATPAEAAIELDNIVLQQSTPGAPRLTWKSGDLSGVAKYRFAWDQNPVTSPTEETMETTRSVELKPNDKRGLWWAHVQAADNAGNWSSVAHLPVIVP